MNCGEESALPVVSWSPCHAGTRASCCWRVLEEIVSGLWEVVVIEEVGLITCERCVVDQKGQTPNSAKCTGDLAPARGSKRSGGWRRRWERQMKSAKKGSKRENTQAHETWIIWRAQTPWATVVWDIIMSANKHEKKVTCKGRWFFSLLTNSGEESALPMVSLRISESCRYEGLVSLEDSRRKISVVSEMW